MKRSDIAHNDTEFQRPPNRTKTLMIQGIMLIVFGAFVTGCLGPAPLHLQNHFSIETQPSEALKTKLASPSSEKMTMGLVIVRQPETYDFPFGEDDYWMNFAGRVKNNLEKLPTVHMDQVIMVKDLESPENVSRIQQLSRSEEYDTIMVVFPSGKEVEGSARFDLLPEVSMLTGRQIDHYATIELGMLDTDSGKLFMQVQGHSFATLEKLDNPINSNRYPRVRGASMTTNIFPTEEQAFETLRAVALDEALEQATMKLQERWPQT